MTRRRLPPPPASPTPLWVTPGANVLALLLGLWLLVAPFVLGFGDHPSAGLHRVVGALVALLAAARLRRNRRLVWLAWIDAALGLWLVITPWLFGQTGLDANPIGLNDLIVGVALSVGGGVTGFRGALATAPKR